LKVVHRSGRMLLAALVASSGLALGVVPLVAPVLADAPAGLMVDVEPDVAQVAHGSQVVLTARVYDKSGLLNAGPGTSTRVRFYFVSGSPNDAAGRGSSADLDCYTNDAGQCSVTYIAARVGIDRICAAIGGSANLCDEAVDAPDLVDRVDVAERTVLAVSAPTPTPPPTPPSAPGPGSNPQGDPNPTPGPTRTPTSAPTPIPTSMPTPTFAPTQPPTTAPTLTPTVVPLPLPGPTSTPTTAPSRSAGPAATASAPPSPTIAADQPPPSPTAGAVSALMPEPPPPRVAPLLSEWPAFGPVEADADVMSAAKTQAMAILRPEVAAEIVTKFSFPLGLAVALLAFMILQSWLDHRDPKLRDAPQTADELVVPFESEDDL